MKSIMSVLAALIMAFALVSISEAGTGSSNKDNPTVFAQTHNAPAGASVKDADRPGHFSTGTPYTCMASPAYQDYNDACAIPYPTNDKVGRVPEPIGSNGS